MHDVNDMLETVSSQEAAAIIGVNPATIARWVAQGKLTPVFLRPARGVPGRRFDRLAIERLAMARRVYLAEFEERVS